MKFVKQYEEFNSAKEVTSEDDLKITITHDKNEIKNVLAGNPSSFKLKNP